MVFSEIFIKHSKHEWFQSSPSFYYKESKNGEWWPPFIFYDANINISGNIWQGNDERKKEKKAFDILFQKETEKSQTDCLTTESKYRKARTLKQGCVFFRAVSSFITYRKQNIWVHVQEVGGWEQRALGNLIGSIFFVGESD